MASPASSSLGGGPVRADGLRLHSVGMSSWVAASPRAATRRTWVGRSSCGRAGAAGLRPIAYEPVTLPPLGRPFCEIHQEPPATLGLQSLTRATKKRSM